MCLAVPFVASSQNTPSVARSRSNAGSDLHFACPDCTASRGTYCLSVSASQMYRLYCTRIAQGSTVRREICSEVEDHTDGSRGSPQSGRQGPHPCRTGSLSTRTSELCLPCQSTSRSCAQRPGAYSVLPPACSNSHPKFIGFGSCNRNKPCVRLVQSQSCTQTLGFPTIYESGIKCE